jgi:hypothetical protein
MVMKRMEDDQAAAALGFSFAFFQLEVASLNLS